MKSKYDIVVIDSGYNNTYDLFIDKQIDSISLSINKISQELVFLEDTNDYIGHGSAVLKVLLDCVNDNPNILVIKIFDKKTLIKEKLLIKTLEYINENINTDFINLSCGLYESKELNKLIDICQELSNKGSIIVSACSNDDNILYPAALNTVLSVDFQEQINDIIFVNNSYADILIDRRRFFVPWLSKERIAVQSTSFAVPYVVGYLYNMKKKFLYNNIEELKKILTNDKTDTIVTNNFKKSVYKILIFTIGNFEFIFNTLYPFISLFSFDLVTHPTLTNKHHYVGSWKSLNFETNYDALIFLDMKDPGKLIGNKYYEKIREHCKLNNIPMINSQSNSIFYRKILLKPVNEKIINKVEFIKNLKIDNITSFMLLSSKIDKHYSNVLNWLITKIFGDKRETEFLFLNSILSIYNIPMCINEEFLKLNNYDKYFLSLMHAKLNIINKKKKALWIEYPFSINNEEKYSKNIINSLLIIQSLKNNVVFLIIHKEDSIQTVTLKIRILKAFDCSIFIIFLYHITDEIINSFTYNNLLLYTQDIYDFTSHQSMNRLIERVKTLIHLNN